ncbi:MAG: hypothetical protein GXO55_10635, partial [Chloroflexi bacterium]|nr:hypothetical protein [Chloroflexota bacterium]
MRGRDKHILILLFGVLLFLLPLFIGWGSSSRAGGWTPMAFRGSTITYLRAGTAEGLTHIYVWGRALGLRRSLDGGRTWSPPLDRTLPHTTWGNPGLTALGIAPHNARLVLASLTDATQSVLYRLNEDDTWQKVRTLATPIQAPLLMAKGENTYIAWGPTLWTWDGDHSWQVVHRWEGEEIRSIAILPHPFPTLFVLTHTLWRSEDQGETWTALETPADVRELLIPPGDSTLYALAPHSLWYSHDRGERWEEVQAPESLRAWAPSATYTGILYFLDVRGRIWRWRADTHAWAQIGTPGSHVARWLATDPTVGNRLYIAGQDGIWQGEDTLPPPTPTPTATPSPTPLPPT